MSKQENAIPTPEEAEQAATTVATATPDADAVVDTTDGDTAADTTDAAEATEEYESAVREFLENKEQLMAEVATLRRQSEELLGSDPADEGTDTTDDVPDASDTNSQDGAGDDGDVEDVPEQESAPQPAPTPIPADGDSGHIADLISDDGDEVSGAVVWSSSGRKFVIVSADGEPVSDLEADQAVALIDAKRLAFDNARGHELFVGRMSEMGVDADQDKVDIGDATSTGELLVTPDELIGNTRHHMTGRHAGSNVAWEDEVDLSDPESTGSQRIEDIINGQAASQGGPAKGKKKVSGRKVYQADMVMTAAALVMVVAFYLVALLIQRPSPFMMGLWTTLCVIAAAAVAMPFTMSMETRARNIGGKFMLTGAVTAVFLVMSVLVVCDAASEGKGPWEQTDYEQVEDEEETQEEADTVMLAFEPSGDVIALNITGDARSYPAISFGDVLVTTSEAGDASSLTANIDGKNYVAQTVATIDGLGISAFAVESAVLPSPVQSAASVSIGQDVIAYAIGADGAAVVEGATIQSTTFPIGVQGVPDSNEVDRVIVDRDLSAGTLVMDKSGHLIGIVPEDGSRVVTGSSIAKAVRVLTSDDDDIYVGIVCRQASVSESEDGGAYVENVLTNSPASNAGIMTGDVIVAVDGEHVDDATELNAIVGSHGAGEQVTFDIIRDGQDVNIGVTIGRHGRDLGIPLDELAGSKPDDGKGKDGTPGDAAKSKDAGRKHLPVAGESDDDETDL